MAKTYETLPLQTLQDWAAEKWLRFEYHPLEGCHFYTPEGRFVGWTPSDRREMAKFIDEYQERPLGPSTGGDFKRDICEGWCGRPLNDGEICVACETRAAQEYEKNTKGGK